MPPSLDRLARGGAFEGDRRSRSAGRHPVAPAPPAAMRGTQGSEWNEVERDMLRRLQAGLVPRLELGGQGLRVIVRHRPLTGLALGGDFVDGIARPDGSLHLVIGDVAGHGPEAAALGARLRIAWRALTLADTPQEKMLDVLSDVVLHERASLEVFATAVSAVIGPRRDRISLVSAGHPGPILVDQPDHAYPLAIPRTPPLGIELHERRQ